MSQPERLLVGPASIDRYVDEPKDHPGGGALNMAYHWSQLDQPFRLISRVSDRDRGLFEPFLARHHVPVTETFYQSGPSCSVEVRIGADRQPVMDNFVEGVWSTFDWSAPELASINSGQLTHLVLVDALVESLYGLAAPSRSASLSGDFLSFRHFTVERFDRIFPLLGTGFIGWPGDPTDDVIHQLAERPPRYGNRLVITFGATGIRVIDGDHTDRWFEVDEVPVRGTTLGCGDAFIAAFLAAWDRTGDLDNAVDAGRALGSSATSWERALPNSAYDRA